MSKSMNAVSLPWRRTAVGAAWIVWFSLLMGTPFFLVRAHVPPSASAMFAYIAVGLAFGSLMAQGGVCESKSYRRLLMVFASGIIMTLISVLPEWVVLPIALSKGFGAGSEAANILGFDLRAFLEMVQPALVLMASGLCGFSLPSTVRLFNNDDLSDLEKGSKLPYLTMASFLTLGFLHSAMMAFSLGVGDGSSFAGGEWPFSTARPIAWMPLMLSAGISITLLSPIGSVSTAFTARYSCFLLVAYSVGVLSWNVLSRIVAVYSSDFYSTYALLSLLACLLVIMLCGFRIIALRYGRKNEIRPSGHISEEDRDALAFERHLFLEAGLTDRESASVNALIRGQTSSQIASEIGVSPSTVRTYLQRSYKKLNVQNAAQLREKMNKDFMDQLAAEPISEAEGQKRAPAWFNARARGLIAAVLCLGPSSLVGTLLLPYQHHLSIWGAGLHVVLGGGLGLLVAGLFATFGVFVVGYRQNESKRAQAKGRSFGRLARLLFSVALLVVGCLTCLWAEGTFSAAAGAFVLAMGVVMLEVFLYESGAHAVLNSKYLLSASALFLALPFVALRIFEFRQMAIMAMLLVVVSCAVLFGLFWLARDDVADKSDVPGLAAMYHTGSYNNLSSTTGALAGVAFFALGFCFYGLWLYSYSHIYAILFGVLLFSFVVIVGVGVLLRVAKGISAPGFVLAVAPTIAVSIFAGIPAFFLIAALVATAIACVVLVKGKVVSVAAIARTCIWMGFGLMAGAIAANLLTDILFYNGVEANPFDNVGVGAVVVLLVAIIGSMVSGAACVLLLKRLAEAHYCIEQKASSYAEYGKDDSVARRVNAFLVSQGLTSLQVSVVEGLARGFSLSQIAQETNYSKSSIMAAKTAALLRLRISSSEDIAERIVSCISENRNEE